MTLRSLVPALGALALAAPAHLAAADMAGITLHGWSDNILVIGDDTAKEVDATKPKEKSAGIGFNSAASVKVNWKVTDRLNAKINLWFDPEYADARMRESYFTYDLGDGFSWTMGKYIDHVGWISAEPTGLYTVNGSLIGYTAAYGNDVIGTSIAFAQKEMPVSGSVHIVNGYFSAADARNRSYNSGASRGRENRDLGYGLDLIVMPNEMISANLEAAYDTSTEAPAGGKGGAAYTLGINATVKTGELTIGVEGIYHNDADDKDNMGAKIDNDKSSYQGLLLANYALGKEPFPMSVTGMFQGYSSQEKNPAGGDKMKTTKAQVTGALLTNPLGDTNFGLNAEVTYWTGKNSADNSPYINGVQFALEGIAVF